MGINETQTGIDLACVSRLTRLSFNNADIVLLNQDVEIKDFGLEEVSLQSALNLAGKAGELTVGICLLFSGANSGHIMLCFRPETACELIDMALGNTPGITTEIGDMGKSVLGEVGNIIGSFFLNTAVEYAGTCLMPSPPAVILDTANAILNSLIAEALEKEENLFIIRVVFSTPDKQIEGRFLTLPVVESARGKMG